MGHNKSNQENRCTMQHKCVQLCVLRGVEKFFHFCEIFCKFLFFLVQTKMSWRSLLTSQYSG